MNRYPNVRRNWIGDLGIGLYEASIKGRKKLAGSGLKQKAKELLDMLKADPFQTPQPYEKLLGDLTSAYSRRITIQHRLVYQVLEEACVVKMLRLWTHYE